MNTSDNPIKSKNEDRLRRTSFSLQIANAIRNWKKPDCLTIGIYGGWGSGKTSVLNMIEEEIGNDENLSIIRFNPWEYGNAIELTIQLFAKIGQELGKKKSVPKKVKKGLLKLAHISIPSLSVPLLDPSSATALPVNLKFENLQNFLEEKIKEGESIGEQKQAINDYLKESNKRIIVFIDDLDRMDREEILQVFKLVRLVGDFDNTTFVLALDPEIISNQISGRKENEQINDQGFLDKIIQIPIPIPALSNGDKVQFFTTLIREIEQVYLPKDDDPFFEFKEYLPHLDWLIPSAPRQMIRFSQYIWFVFPLVINELNLTDFLIISLMRHFHKPLYDFILKERIFFLYGHWIEEGTSDPKLVNFSGTWGGGSTVKNNGPYRELITKLNNAQLAPRMTQLLKMLFPEISDFFPETNLTFLPLVKRKYSDESPFLKKLISTPEYFPKYFSFEPRIDDRRDVEVDQFEIAIKNATKISEVRTTVFSIKNHDNPGLFFKKLTWRETKYTKRNSSQLFNCLIELGNDLLKPHERERFSMVNLFKLLLSISRQVPAKQVERSIIRFVKKKEYQFFLLRLIWASTSENEDFRKNRTWDLERWRDFGKTYFSKIHDFYSPDPVFIANVQISPLFYLTWASISGKETVCESLSPLFEDSPKYFIKYIKQHFSEKGPESDWGIFTSIDFGYLHKTLGSNFIVQFIRKKFPTISPKSFSNPDHEYQNDEEILAHLLHFSSIMDKNLRNNTSRKSLGIPTSLNE